MIYRNFKAINNHENLTKSKDFVMICDDYSIPTSYFGFNFNNPSNFNPNKFENYGIRIRNQTGGVKIKEIILVKDDKTYFKVQLIFTMTNVEMKVKVGKIPLLQKDNNIFQPTNMLDSFYFCNENVTTSNKNNISYKIVISHINNIQQLEKTDTTIKVQTHKLQLLLQQLKIINLQIIQKLEKVEQAEKSLQQQQQQQQRRQRQTRVQPIQQNNLQQIQRLKRIIKKIESDSEKIKQLSEQQLEQQLEQQISNLEQLTQNINLQREDDINLLIGFYSNLFIESGESEA